MQAPSHRCGSTKTKSGNACQVKVKQASLRCYRHVATGSSPSVSAKQVHRCGSFETKGGGACKARVKSAALRCYRHVSITPTPAAAAAAAPIATTGKAKIKAKASNNSNTHRCGSTATRSGKPCRGAVKTPGTRCYQHNVAATPHRNLRFDHRGPRINHAKLGIRMSPPAQMALRIKIRNAHKRVPLKDKPGWIYCYSLMDDAHRCYWKVGRTDRKPAVRLAEWPGAVLKYAVAIPFNKLAETLFFVLMDEARLVRYVFKSKGKTSGKEYITVTRGTSTHPRALVADATVDGIRESGHGPLAPFTQAVVDSVRASRMPNLGSRTKEVEWVFSEWRHVHAAMGEVQRALVEWERTKQ